MNRPVRMTSTMSSAMLSVPMPILQPNSCRSCTRGLKPRRAAMQALKATLVRDLAERLSDGRLDPDVLRSLPDDELMAALTAIPGIGPWTVQGAMIIALQRDDV